MDHGLGRSCLIQLPSNWESSGQREMPWVVGRGSKEGKVKKEIIVNMLI